MSSSGNSSRFSANSSVHLSDTMSILRATIDKHIEEDMKLLKTTIDLSLPDFKRFERISITTAMVESKIDENEKHLNRISQTRNADSVDINVRTDNITKSTDELNKLFNSFKRISEKFTQKSKKTCLQDNDKSENRVVDVDSQTVEQLLERTHQLKRLQNSQKFIQNLNK